MQDIRTHFPGCTLSSDQIKDTIKKLLGIETDIFCYCCFKKLQKSSEILTCEYCHQFYCSKCSVDIRGKGRNSIDTMLCLQCIENRKSIG